jgi:hypothetical protein
MPFPDAPPRPSRRRRHIISVRLSDAELEQIQARADAHSRTPTDYMRRVALGHIPALRGSFNHEPPSLRETSILAVPPAPQG